MKKWVDLGAADKYRKKTVQEISIGKTKIALIYSDKKLSAISGKCNHEQGPLGKGIIDGNYVACPWHYWKFHKETGEGEPGYEKDRVPSYELRIDKKDRLFINLTPIRRRGFMQHKKHTLERKVQRNSGPIRILGISTTAMGKKYPRFSTSDFLLEKALSYARKKLKAKTKTLRLNDLHINHCEGFYSKDAKACTWPCSITTMDKKDEMSLVYEALVHWCDAVIVATPIRWGAASSLYYKMAERMNCIQNQITVKDKVLVKNKIASFIITGGQDNIQSVAGQMLGFFAELGFLFPAFPYIAHSLGWSAENMGKNMDHVRKSRELRCEVEKLVERFVKTAKRLGR